ncbi:carbohydrate ABC transporter permease [Brachybacterium sp. YJGR34]|uniref:carbohydrate ABC transporter permease n=1 Tax=Brachybacterium sp. YJGR34 TaxID=2059911 RepID=UPI001E573194|nr:sugar ABC transporter permease [Brachybacterium sp. YJGR34]
MILFTLYTVWPSLSSLYYSMLEWRGLGQDRSFTGLANFARLLTDDLFWASLGITLLIIVVTVPIRVGASLLLAIMLNDPRLPFAGLLRTAFFVPVVATTAIVGILMGFVLDPSSGPVNALRELVGLAPIDFLGSSDTALGSVMAVHVWKWLGVTLIYWLAALQTVPRELLEAAEIDGASSWQRLRHVTLPLLTPFTIIITVLTVVETMQIFDLVVTMTGGGPYFSTMVTEVYIYDTAFGEGRPDLGYASAIGVAFGVITVLLIALLTGLMSLARRRQEGHQ